MMAEKGMWWSMQPMDARGEDAFQFENPISTAKYEACDAGHLIPMEKPAEIIRLLKTFLA